MTPNSWASVFGYIAKCELNGVVPSFSAFFRLMTLSKSPGASDRWLDLSYKGSYRTVVGKASKWHFWRKKWIVLHTSDKEMVRRVKR